MKKTSRYLLQLGLAITFITIGFMILQDPLGWGSLLQPWAAKIVGSGLQSQMIETAYVDIAIGILFLIPWTIWLASLIGSIHIIIVLIVTGIETITIRDVGLLAATLVLFIETIPPSVVRWVFFWRK